MLFDLEFLLIHFQIKVTILHVWLNFDFKPEFNLNVPDQGIYQITKHLIRELQPVF